MANLLGTLEYNESFNETTDYFVYYTIPNSSGVKFSLRYVHYKKLTLVFGSFD